MQQQLYCPRCRQAVQPGKRFCNACGFDVSSLLQQQISPQHQSPTNAMPLSSTDQKSSLTCSRCNKKIGLMDRITFNKQTGRCGKCEGEVQNALRRFRLAFLQACQDGILTDQEWGILTQGATNDGLSMIEALQYVRGDAIHFLERTLAFASADSMLTQAEEDGFHRLRRNLMVPDTQIQELLHRLTYLKHLTSIRQGSLPVVQPHATLETDEICYLECDAVYQKVTAKAVVPVHGRLLATNKQIHFLSSSGGWTIPWKSVMNTVNQANGVYLELTKKQGNGLYLVPDPTITEAILQTLMRIAKRQLVGQSNDAATRHIPHEIKIAVWQRDGGKCVQCGATSYLEYDHIIPFTKGGASTVNNVQILCRRCNLQKSDRI